MSEPNGIHPVISAIPNWQKKVCLPWNRAARLRRNMIKRGIKLVQPRPITKSSQNWSEWECVLNAAMSNMATPGVSTYGILSHLTDAQYKYITGAPRDERTAPYGTRNEFNENPSLLKYLRFEGRVQRHKDSAFYAHTIFIPKDFTASSPEDYALSQTTSGSFPPKVSAA